VHVIGAGDLADCRALADRVIAPGGSEPDWGPADVNVSQAPSPPAAGSKPGAGSSAPRSTKLALTRVKLGPHAFPAARRGPGVIAARAGALLRYRLSEPARLTLTVRRHGRKVRGALKTAGRPGDNAVRLTGRIARHSLAPGRYKLRIVARDLTRRERATAMITFRIVR
jgi:hypothetical protein